jgi:hypothetical protein
VAMMDALPPAAWRLDWLDFQGHHVGNARPRCHHKRFKSQSAALRELDRLAAIDDADIRGFVSAVPPKPPLAEQVDFGFPPGGECRLMD